MMEQDFIIPRCYNTPFDDEDFCPICGKDPGDCECPECPECGAVGELDCIYTHGLPVSPVIWSCRQLAREWLGEDLGEADSRRLLDRRIYKWSSSGCSFYAGGITVSGYCEGSDAELPAYVLEFGKFTLQDFKDALDAADADGMNEWDMTQGCERCAAMLGVSSTDYFLSGIGNTPVQENCPSCGGRGEVI